MPIYTSLATCHALVRLLGVLSLRLQLQNHPANDKHSGLATIVSVDTINLITTTHHNEVFNMSVYICH